MGGYSALNFNGDLCGIIQLIVDYLLRERKVAKNKNVQVKTHRFYQ